MIDFAINVEMLYPGMDICEKIERVHAAGFQAIEFWGWQDKDLAKLKATCKHLGVKVRAFSGTGDWSLCDREHSGEYIDWIKKTIEVAKDLECDTLILFPNHFTPNGCADFRRKYSHDSQYHRHPYPPGARAGGGEYDRAARADLQHWQRRRYVGHRYLGRR